MTEMTDNTESENLERRMMSESESSQASTRGHPAVMGVMMNVEVVLGRAEIPLGVLLSMSKGAVVELDRKIGDKVDLTVNGKVIAYGKLVEMSDDKVGVEMTEIVEKPSLSAG